MAYIIELIGNEIFKDLVMLLLWAYNVYGIL